MNRISSITIALLIFATFLFVPHSGSTNGQVPPIGIIDFYGLRSITEQQVRQALQIKEGDALPESMKESRRRLESLTNVEQARLNATCCEAGKFILYVEIRERGSPILRFRVAPKGVIRLPENIAQVGGEYQKAYAAEMVRLHLLPFNLTIPCGILRIGSSYSPFTSDNNEEIARVLLAHTLLPPPQFI